MNSNKLSMHAKVKKMIRKLLPKISRNHFYACNLFFLSKRSLFLEENGSLSMTAIKIRDMLNVCRFITSR